MCLSGFCSHDLGNQAKLLSVAGKAEAASELFSQALRTALECVRTREAEQPRGAEAQSALFMCEVSNIYPFSPYATPHSPHISEFNSFLCAR